MNYTTSMDYLKGLTKFGINLGLDRIRDLLTRIGNPERKVEFVHVAGTNGKGSTCAILASILKDSGLKVGLFTSPHLHSYTERIKINGHEITEEDVAEILTMMRVHLDKIVEEGGEHPTEFEVSTALALYYFAREKVDIAVMEEGMGGEIDSTNVIIPRLSLITNVGMDHMDYLGPMLEDIARVKAGIIKEGVAVLTTCDHPAALEVIRQVAKEKHAPLWEEGKDFWAEPLEQSENKQKFQCWVKDTLFPDLSISLRGKHQLKNAALAVAAAVKTGISSKAIRLGIEHTIWPCRLETVWEKPLVILDAAHNYHGILALIDSLKEYWPDKKKVLLIGMLADKEREKVATEIAPLAEKIVVTKPNSPRAGKWEQVADFVRPFTDKVIVEESITRAVDEVIKLAGDDDMVIITGSIYMVSEARAYLLRSMPSCKLSDNQS
ncbi:MAG: bifunctional folylpolyglutamate synthase/dihydrofolate synthase [Clostridia bacterium]|nr:bifunctional folylpolyglutamate synthase/dihydrofolate synthase [Clostridia bacterium]